MKAIRCDRCKGFKTEGYEHVALRRGLSPEAPTIETWDLCMPCLKAVVAEVKEHQTVEAGPR